MGKVTTPTRQRCDSYDIFDTLLGRWYFFPESIFQEIEHETGFKHFTHYRKKASEIAQSKSLKEIYEAFQQLTRCSDECLTKLRKLEIFLESKRLFPIAQYAKQIQPNDIAVSDMYLSKSVIAYLLKKHQIHFSNDHLYVSPAGKATGEIYPMIKEKHNIRRHIGDNLQTDIRQATDKGIQAEVCDPHFTGLEQELIKRDFTDIALLSRVVRLKNSQDCPKLIAIWNEAVEINLPLMICAAIAIHQLAQKTPYRYLLFAQRDCCHLLKIYKALYPNCCRAKAFYLSRKCLYEPSDAFLSYAKANLERSLYIDITFSGRSIYYFHQTTGISFEVFAVMLHSKYFYKIKQSCRKKIKVHYFVSSMIHRDTADFEVFNYDVNGSVADYTGKIIRFPIEYTRKEVRIAHEVTDKAVALIRQGFHLPSAVEKQPYQKLRRLAVILAKYIHYVPCKMHIITRVEVYKINYKNNTVPMKRGWFYFWNKLVLLFYYRKIRRWLDRRIVKRIIYRSRHRPSDSSFRSKPFRYKRRDRERIRHAIFSGTK
ncbi:MAG: hypothetical protein GY821_04600 [Gammaproteobacteria bacterium]|nr:hypothetical protein [Gammaproteobacteria bacterium]